MINYFKACADLKLTKERKKQLQSELQTLNKDEETLLNVIEDMKKARNEYLKSNDIIAKVFVYYFFDSLKPKHIAHKIPCHIDTVYHYIKQVKKHQGQLPKKSEKKHVE